MSLSSIGLWSLPRRLVAVIEHMRLSNSEHRAKNALPMAPVKQYECVQHIQALHSICLFFFFSVLHIMGAVRDVINFGPTDFVWDTSWDMVFNTMHIPGVQVPAIFIYRNIISCPQSFARRWHVINNEKSTRAARAELLPFWVDIQDLKSPCTISLGTIPGHHMSIFV
jgi:hypothetical protein